MNKSMFVMALAVAAQTAHAQALEQRGLIIDIDKKGSYTVRALVQPEGGGDLVPGDLLAANISGKDPASPRQLVDDQSEGDVDDPIFTKGSGLKFRNWDKVADPGPAPTDEWWISFKYLTYGIENVLYHNFEYAGWSFVQPQLRVYFDTGHDDVRVIKDGRVFESQNGEADMFQDGDSVLPQLTIFEYQLRNQLGEKSSKWFWGPNFGIGITEGGEVRVRDITGLTNAEIADEAMGVYSRDKINALALTLDFSVSLDYMLKPSDFQTSPSLSLQGGYSFAYSSAEDLDDPDDGALFVGIVLNMTF